jgi:hypothetical protein
VLLCVFPSQAEQDIQTNVKVNAGMRLIEEFYMSLLTNNPIEQCPAIFAPDSLGVAPDRQQEKMNLCRKWEFLRENKKIFLTEPFENNEFYLPQDFFRKSRKVISFTNPTQGDYTSGHLYITLLSTVTSGCKDGVFKEISFPIAPVEGTDGYKIEFFLIKINGALLDPYGEFQRDYDLWVRLGFKKEPHAPTK